MIKVTRLREKKGDGTDSWLTITGPLCVASITAGFLILIGGIFSHGSIAVELFGYLGITNSPVMESENDKESPEDLSEASH